MKNLTISLFLFLLPFFLKSEVTLKMKSAENKDLSCITLLQIASEKSKNGGEMVKYKKIKIQQKKSNKKQPNKHISDEKFQLHIYEHNVKIEEKGKRYINKGLQKCGLK